MSKIVSVSLALFISCFSFGQKLDLKARIDSLIIAKKEKPFNGVILISQHGKIKYNSINGFSDLESKIPLKIDDQFVIGSISKQFTAVLILQEFDQGHIDIFIPIKRYLPELKQSWADNVTIHHLLTHLHGITELDKPTLFKAGTQYSYSQLGYDLLAEILERVTGKSFSVISTELFRKCKMKNTFHPDIRQYNNLVKGYTEQSNGSIQFDSLSFENYVAAGGFVSNVNDLNLWSQNLHNGKLLKDKTYRRMITKQKNATRQHPIFGITTYGYGLTISDQNEVVRLGQTGFAPGFVSMNFYYPESQTSVVVLGNVAYDVNDLKQTFYYHLQVLKIVKEHLKR